MRQEVGQPVALEQDGVVELAVLAWVDGLVCELRVPRAPATGARCVLRLDPPGGRLELPFSVLSVDADEGEGAFGVVGRLTVRTRQRRALQGWLAGLAARK